MNVYYVAADGGLNLLPHNEPENGNFDWSPKQANIGTGWAAGRTLAGPDGVMYSIVPSGELRRFHWLDNGTWSNGGSPRSVGNGWGRYTQAEHRNKITVDEKGRLFEINPDGYLKVFVWEGDDATGSWTPETGGGKVLDSGWNQYNLIVAAGDGVLYARKPSGELFRFRYDAASDRFVQYAQPAGVGWEHYNRILSVGGDVLYGTWGVNGGQLVWYRYNEDSNTWANSGSGRVVGTGWSSEVDVVADTNGCRLSGYPQPTHPVSVPAKFDAPTSVVQGDDGRPNYFFVNSQGVLVHGRQTTSGDLLQVTYMPLPGYTKYTGQPGATLQENGNMEVQALSYEDGDVRGKTQAVKNGTWHPGLFQHRGHLLGHPVLAKGSDGLISSFGVDEQGNLWHRRQVAVNGAFSAWRNIGAGLSTDITAVRSGDGFEVVARHADNSFRAARFANGVLGTWRNLGGTDGRGKAAAVVHGDGKLQVVVRRADDKIYTQRENSAGFPGTWQIVDDITANGDPAAVVTTRGTVEAAVRGTDNKVHTTGQTITGGQFRPWDTRDFNEAGTDVFGTALSSGQWLFTWRDPAGDIYSYQGTFGSSKAKQGSASGPVYTGGKAGS